MDLRGRRKKIFARRNIHEEIKNIFLLRLWKRTFSDKDIERGYAPTTV